MFWEDVLYVAILVFCVFIGDFYKRIEGVHEKQWICTLLGFILATTVSGSHVIHPIICSVINAIIITKISPKKCHLASFFFSFFYLLFLFRLGTYIGLPESPSHTNLLLMILTLKLSGLAFEVNAAASQPSDDPEGVNSDALKNVGVLDVFHYGFSYMGILTGPYYRYRTYWDHLHRPFSKYVDPKPLTYSKLKQVAAFIVLYLMMNASYPTRYVTTDAFAERSFLFRYFYMYPTFFSFKLRMYIGMSLAECACQMAGLGAYPVKANPVIGLGPRDYKAIETMTHNAPGELKDEEYNFDTVYNMNVAKLETCHLTRTAMKSWNACIQYWMGVYIYKRFPYKNLRTLATFTLSAAWHGWQAGYYFCMCQIPLFLMSEDIGVKFYNQSKEGSLARMGWRLLLWYEKTTCMAYLGVPFLLLGMEESLQYYKSIYFAGHILAIVLYVSFRFLKPYILKPIENKAKDN
ncbi:membrane bound O-acyltransferase domain containing farjavit [Nomia melanderi]|uniref:membrane bound O-acyltransferase domain containing farjavit n=1 Tax=Nomia melanderi TaxID=2448451 RepID=UPI001303FE26|nr:lysophospholipid acyltransferase 7 [Nomia melanderi]